jgi:hypothetical protein
MTAPGLSRVMWYLRKLINNNCFVISKLFAFNGGKHFFSFINNA